MSSQLSSLLDIAKLKELTQCFFNITEIPFAILDYKGKVFIESPDFKMSCTQCSNKCFENLLDEKNKNTVNYHEVENLKYKLHYCSNGFMCAIAPLFINDELIAYIFINQFLNERPNVELLYKNVNNKFYYIENLLKIPVVKKARLESILIYLSKFIDVIGESAINQLKAIKMQEELTAIKHEMEASFQQLAAAESELSDNYEDLLKKEKALRESDERYRLLFSSMNQGMAHHEIITDENGDPCDYRYLSVNPSYEKMTDFKQEVVVGKTVMEINSDIKEDRIKLYGEVALQGKSKEFEIHSNKLGKYFKIYAYSPKFKEFAVLVSDITEEKKLEFRLKKSFMEIVESLGYMIEKRDLYTAGHQKNVSKLACRIGKAMGLSEEQLEGLYVAAILHDIGKIGIPSEILTKPARLNSIEFNLIKTHPQNAYEILKSIDFQWPVADIVLQHHEKLDGSGYPYGLVKNEILLEAKIITVADVVEAIASHRPYRPALGLKYAMEEITNNSGVLYDADIVKICLEICKKDSTIFESP